MYVHCYTSKASRQRSPDIRVRFCTSHQARLVIHIEESTPSRRSARLEEEDEPGLMMPFRTHPYVWKALATALRSVQRSHVEGAITLRLASVADTKLPNVSELQVHNRFGVPREWQMEVSLSDEVF